MTDRTRALDRLEVLRSKDLRDEAHPLVELKNLSVAFARCNAGTFLAAMLEGEESVVGQQGCILVPENGEDAAFVFGTVGFGRGMRGREVQQDGAVG